MDENQQNETRERLDNITETLQRLIEQTQVKASLLKLEAQQSWQDFEKIFFKIQNMIKKDWQNTKSGFGEAQVQLHLGLMEAREEWNEFQEELRDSLKKLNAGEPIDEAKLQAHLAKMDIEDRFKEKRDDWSKNYNQKIKPEIKALIREMQEEMQTLAKSLVD